MNNSKSSKNKKEQVWKNSDNVENKAEYCNLI